MTVDDCKLPIIYLLDDGSWVWEEDINEHDYETVNYQRIGVPLEYVHEDQVDAFVEHYIAGGYAVPC